MKKRGDHRTLHLVLVGIILLGFVAFSLFNIFGVFNTTGNPILRSLDSGASKPVVVQPSEEICDGWITILMEKLMGGWFVF